jgi:hypothetical protein
MLCNRKKRENLERARELLNYSFEAAFNDITPVLDDSIYRCPICKKETLIAVYPLLAESRGP